MKLVVIDPDQVAPVNTRASHGTMPTLLVVAGIVFAALTEAVAGTALSTARLDMIGDTHATLDQFALLEVGYTAAKLTAFMLTPWLMGRLSSQTCLRAATGIMTLVCGAAALTYNFDTLVVLRLLQGLAGGALLVSGQTLLFQTFSRSLQPVVQCFFAFGAVVAPATLTPYMQGWLLDSLSWTWIFLSIVPIGLSALALLASTDLGADAQTRAVRLDRLGAVLFTIAAFCLTFVLNQGSRWDWLEEPMIVHLLLVGVVSLLLFIAFQLCATGSDTILDLAIFRNSGFAFGFIASFAAGFALFGSAYLIPSFAISVLGMTPTEAGMLLLPSTLMFISALLLTTFLVRRGKLPPIITVPFGILGFIVAMWMLSGSNGESGFSDLMPAILLRGLALGFLFLSITLITLLDLEGPQIAYGVGLFNVGRQTGGLFGVAVMQTLLDHQTALNKGVIATYIVPGRMAVTERLALLTNSLTSHGMELSVAAKAAVQILTREVTAQASIIAFDTAFLTLSLFFIAAAPVLITLKIIIGRALGSGSETPNHAGRGIGIGAQAYADDQLGDVDVSQIVIRPTASPH
ncbi:MFS transporter (plasmid) [Rhizobium sp. CC1099]|uniref:MFS transporter n=1 Tax=Rhizobium sp. CC1099 TaxID=3039160 RepID=UPI0024B0B28B|nr:MFS transporter [Rhizobium sp. CC1099]WFU91229.1 MFS transporter [Rhizobium sp. CC1099]